MESWNTGTVTAGLGLVAILLSLALYRAREICSFSEENREQRQCDARVGKAVSKREDQIPEQETLMAEIRSQIDRLQAQLQMLSKEKTQVLANNSALQKEKEERSKPSMDQQAPLPPSINLVKNPKAVEGTKHWKILEGDITTEDNMPPGSDPIPSIVNRKGMLRNWATSYKMSKKTQMISLATQGITSTHLDDPQAELEVSEWVAGRWDSASFYTMELQLFDSAMTVLDNIEVTKAVGGENDNHWGKVQHTFCLKNYKEPRYLSFTHGGIDKHYWAGYYGPKFTGASVILRFGQNCQTK